LVENVPLKEYTIIVCVNVSYEDIMDLLTTTEFLENVTYLGDALQLYAEKGVLMELY
jgi:hypothetical protein